MPMCRTGLQLWRTPFRATGEGSQLSHLERDRCLLTEEFPEAAPECTGGNLGVPRGTKHHLAATNQ
jgi:hypothetical protein